MKKVGEFRGEVWDVSPEPEGCGSVVFGAIAVLVLILAAGFLVKAMIPFVIVVLKVALVLSLFGILVYLAQCWSEESGKE